MSLHILCFKRRDPHFQDPIYYLRREGDYTPLVPRFESARRSRLGLSVILLAGYSIIQFIDNEDEKPLPLGSESDCSFELHSIWEVNPLKKPPIRC
jgi:hypothetical protein